MRGRWQRVLDDSIEPTNQRFDLVCLGHGCDTCFASTAFSVPRSSGTDMRRILRLATVARTFFGPETRAEVEAAVTRRIGSGLLRRHCLYEDAWDG